MYSTCLFCKNSLGANEAIEQFPIGRRLAFDGAKGRLWVVCRKCERWNLSPLEERWEAIEECERSFRGTRLRTSTEEIGLARLTEGLELVRIGKPLRPEFAAWRYGDQFGARRRRNLVRGGAVLAGVIAVPLLGAAAGLSVGGLGLHSFDLVRLGHGIYNRVTIAARIPAADGAPLVVRLSDVNQTVVLPPKSDQPWGLNIPHRRRNDAREQWWRFKSPADMTELRGEDALRAAAQLLPHLNSAGAKAQEVQDAVALASRSNDPVESFTIAARVAAKTRSWNEFGKGAMLGAMNVELRLSLEMISHEESERRAMEGELHVLEEAWREAEEIAGISDNLFLPTDISTRLAEMKERAG